MPKVLMNEGRVVGYSAYELYVRQHYIVDPDTPPASEQEWLASMLGMGSSMLLRIGTDNIDGDHYIEVDFPKNSRLCAASNIIASFFDGAGYVGDSVADTYTGWAERVTDYGRLITNTHEDRSPSYDGKNIMPISGNVDSVSSDTYAKISEYMKITDGIVIQPGSWLMVQEVSDRPPYKRLIPKLSESPKLRIAVSDKITNPFFILLTGFADRTVVGGMVDVSGIVPSKSPENGDFLGPAAFPWSAKILFSVPPMFMSLINSSSNSNSYTRSLPNDNGSKTITVPGIVDLESSRIVEYYNTNHPDASIDVNVISIETPAPVLTVFQISESVSPALYGANVTKTDADGIDNKIYPIDIAAPGTLKLYHGDLNDSSEKSAVKIAETLEDSVPYNTAFVRDGQSYVVYQIDQDAETIDTSIIPVSDTMTENIQALQVYNTQYVWMFKHNKDGGVPDVDDLKSVNSFIINRHISGYVSDEFVDKYCMSYEYVSNLKTMDKKIYDLEHIFFGMVTQLENKGVADNYVYFVYSTHQKHDIASQQYSLIPVNKQTNQISIMVPNAKSISGISTGIDFYTTNKLDYLGSWFGGSTSDDDDNDPNTRSYGVADADGVGKIIKYHPIQSVAIKDVDVFYQPNAIVPNPPRDEYKYDYLQWLKDTSVTDMIPFSNWETLGIHESYKSLSAHEFLMMAATHDVSKDLTSADSILSQSASNLIYLQYIISKSSVENTIASGFADDGSFNTPLIADLKISARFSSNDYFAPQTVVFESIDDTNTVIANVTDTYTSASNAVWSSVCRSGRHVTKSISLVDPFGSPLSLVGSADTIESDKITWQSLLTALNHNKSVDIIGDSLRDIKSVMSNPDFPTNTVFGIRKNEDGRFTLVEIT